MIPFADSTNPAAINPTVFSHVAGYSDGRYQWPDMEFGRYRRHIKIAVLPGVPEQAEIARVLDIERYDANPGDFPDFALHRNQLGHLDATAYCSLDAVPKVWDAMVSSGLSVRWRLWIAWWWLRPFAPTAADVLAELHALTGIQLPPGLLWACQWRNGPTLDESVLYGRDDFAGSQ